jgi:hypothetical protein
MPNLKSGYIQYPPNALTLVKSSWEGGTEIIHFPVMPESVNIMRQFLMTITNTEGGAFIDDYGMAPSPMTIQGTFGYNTKAMFGLIPLTGFAWTKTLERFVAESHIQESNGEFPIMILCDWYAQNFYEVVLNDFSMQQAVGRNFLWMYRMQMTLLRPIEDAGPLSDPLLALLASKVMQMLINTEIRGSVGRAGAAVGSVVNDVAKVIL